MANLALRGKAGETLGIDMGSRLTKLVKLRPSEKGEPLVTYSDVLDFGHQTPNVESLLKATINKNKLSGLKTAASLDDPSFKIRKLELPKMPEADLREAVKWKMRDIVEGSIDDYIVRHSLLPGTGDAKRMTLVGYAVRKKAVTSLLTLLEKSGLLAEFIEPSAVSIATSIQTQVPSDDEWICGIDLGQSHALLVIVGQGVFYFSRPLAGIQLSLAESERASFNQRLAAEIQNSLDTFAVTFNVEHISRLFLSGGGALLEGLDEYLTQNLGINTQKSNPFFGVNVPEKLFEALKSKAPLLAQATALARIKL